MSLTPSLMNTYCCMIIHCYPGIMSVPLSAMLVKIFETQPIVTSIIIVTKNIIVTISL